MDDAVAPGWYPDPWGQAPQRFWDGAAWTPGVAHQPGPARARPPLADGERTSTASIWAVAVLPVISAFSVLLVRFDTAALVDELRRADELARAGEDGSVVGFDPFSVFGPGLLVAQALSLLTLAAMVVLAYRDHRHLTRIGLVRPFHWAWAFLGGIVYVIGRTVVVRKVAPQSSRAPMWTAVVVAAVGYVVLYVWVGIMTVAMVDALATLASP